MIAVLAQDRDKVVRECFSSDPGYVQYHWASEKGLEACIKITLRELSTAEGLQLWQVMDGGELVGMFGVENNTVLNPFFIKPEYRKRDSVAAFLNLVLGKLNKKWYMGLYEKNLPVNNFFRRLGGKQVSKGKWNRQEVFIYEFDNGRLE